jgi:phenylacetate-CoA ligase
MKWAYSEIWADLFWKALWRGFEFAGLTPDKRVLSLYSPAIGEISKNSLIIREAFDPNEVENDLKLARNFKPQFAYFYSSSAYILASYLIKADERLPLEGFIVTSDQLHPQYRKVIEEAFQCELYNNYGCNDGGAWGAECEEHSGFHHDFERSILEFDEDGACYQQIYGIMLCLLYAIKMVMWANGLIKPVNVAEICLYLKSMGG